MEQAIALPLEVFLAEVESGVVRPLGAEPLSSEPWEQGAVTYWYEGQDPATGHWCRLPRTALAEAIARGLMRQLPPIDSSREGKMYGVLVVQTPAGDWRVLKAVSGAAGDGSQGWVPNIAERSPTDHPDLDALEVSTLHRLSEIKHQLQTLKTLPERADYALLLAQQAEERRYLSDRHRHRKQQRQARRQPHLQVSPEELAQLEEESRRDGIELRHLKRRHQQARQPLEAAIAQADEQIRQLKRDRQTLSRTLQQQLHHTYRLRNFSGEWRSLPSLYAQSPSGTGDCCAPKLLHFAATHHLIPLALAEFWWGPPMGDRQPGQFYGACTDRCQPLMGFMLSGLAERVRSQTLDILYEDDWLAVVNKPAGLLSVPGRTSDRQDSVVRRWGTGFVAAVHRLDQDTSGLLVLAKTADSERHLRHQFQTRQVEKQYEAIVAGRIDQDGEIDLPLWGDPSDRPRQRVDGQRGKPSRTLYRVLEHQGDRTRLALTPLTGRTHQLRVHMAEGLGAPILGDRLYGQVYGQATGDRLYLHAVRLRFTHPHSGRSLEFVAPAPF